MKGIPVNDDLIVLVDDEDLEWLSQYNWYASKIGGSFYAICSQKPRLYMHRLISSKYNWGFHIIDHRDGNGLNNQKNNLRSADKSQNGINRGPNRNNQSGYKGVSRKKEKWVAQICIRGKKIYLGWFEHKEDAARAYDTAAKEYFGEFAFLNFK